MPAEFVHSFAPETGGFSDQEWWDPSCLFDGPTDSLVPPPTHFLADGNPVVQPPPVLSHDVYNAKPTMTGSDLPSTTNQEDYSLTDQERGHIYNVPTQPPKNHDQLLAQGNTHVQPLLLPSPPPPAQISESVIPEVVSSLPTPPTLKGEEHSMTDQEWCDFHFEGSIDPDDELECAFGDLLERMAGTIRKMYSMPPTSSETKVVALPPKVPQASNAPELHSLGQGKRQRNHWTEEEHRLFLEGIKAYGYGEWMDIARDFVKTRTHIQLASHAQKYSLRQLSNGSSAGSTKRKRKSIHDITTDHIPNPNRRR